MTYRAPVTEIAFCLKHGVGLSLAVGQGCFSGLADADIDVFLEEAGHFANVVIAPLNRVSDQHGTPFNAGAITMPPGWKAAYSAWSRAGWNGLAAPVQRGGRGLPYSVNAACIEMWSGASTAFGLGPLLTMSAVEALAAHGSEELKTAYLTKLISGEWMATLQLTEAQAGSDVGALRTRAEPGGDGTYRLTGEKIFVSYGEHDLTDNIIHFVLARLPDAPPGSDGISLFLVPKFLLTPDGSCGLHNDVRATSIEQIIGIHGSPTCTMMFGERGGAVGYLIGDENRGLDGMRTMMNHMRLAVALQGVAIAERASQQALAYARARKQGHAPGAGEDASALICYPDVKRMLLTMRALTRAARIVCYATARAVDDSRCHPDDGARASAQRRAGLLTPIAKAFATDIGAEVASLGMQVHGGVGCMEATGAAQHLREAHIAQIIGGTNGMQAVDLVTRELPTEGGAPFQDFLGKLRKAVVNVHASDDPAFADTGDKLGECVEHLERATAWLMERLDHEPEAGLAGATPYLRLFGYAAGGCGLAHEAVIASRMGVRAEEKASRIATARFFASHIAVRAPGLVRAIVEGSASLLEGDAALAV